MWETWIQSWVGKITWRRERLPTPVFWPREFHGHSPWGPKGSDRTEWFSVSLSLELSRLPVHHQLPELAQTHVYWVGDAIQPSHPLSSPSPPAFNLSQHQGLFQGSQLFKSDGQSTGASVSAAVLPMNTRDWWPLGLTDWISLQSKGLSRVFSNTIVQKHQFFNAQLSL